LRGLCSIKSDDSYTRFLTGTSILNGKNSVAIFYIIYKIYLLQVCEEANTLMKYAFDHNELIWFEYLKKIRDVTCSNIIPDIFATIYSKNCIIIKFYTLLDFEIIKLLTIDDDCNRLEWNPCNNNILLALSHSHVNVYDISGNIANNISSIAIEDEYVKFSGIKWNPHLNSNTFLHFSQGDLSLGDIRTPKLKKLYNFPFSLIDLDFNPNVPDIICTGGTDCYLRIFDLRNINEALITRKDHSHWLYSVKYNHTHDQLIVTAGGDHRTSTDAKQ
ncbi:hypothetical protein MXB_3521, partial [Myxobolus squamalis]